MGNKYTRELRSLDLRDLEQRLVEAKAELTGIRFGLATRQTENTARLSETTRQIARIQTILSELKQEA